MPYLYQAPGLQGHPVPGDAHSTHSSNQSFEQLRQECLWKGVLFEDPDFLANSSSLFFSERPQIPFVWKRPGIKIVENPEFILGGATRTDICQGGLGDCWLLAAIASLTLNEKALARVIPQDQGFGPGYARIFHFQFWQHSEWLDVVIDDRLPTFRDRLIFLHSADNEFWSTLLEKAYAKLNGSYEALKGGSAIEAMEDFTGGVTETFTTKEAPVNFYEILEKALKRGSLVGCSIDTRTAAESEARTPFGLIKGHAYSVTGIDQVNFCGQKVELRRVRNPWGQVEWNGPWSALHLWLTPFLLFMGHTVQSNLILKDESKSFSLTFISSEWRAVDPAEQQCLCHTTLDDGEFWMAFRDFKAHLDKVEICNLNLSQQELLNRDSPRFIRITPGAEEEVDSTKLHNHQMVLGHKCTAVPLEMPNTFWTNPQIKLSLTEKDDGQEGCTFRVALMQKDRRKLKRFGASMLTIGYANYQCPGKEEHLNKDLFKYHASQARSKTFINLREVSDRFKLPPGEYTLIPSTFEPHQEADFCLRIFSEKKAITQDLDGDVDIDLPEIPKPTAPGQETEEEKQFRALFERVAREDMEVTAEELEYVLNAVLQKKKDIKFKKLSLVSCKNIISLMDTSGNGKLEFDEFKVFWGRLRAWTSLFLQCDADRSGTMSSYELRTVLRAAGFQLNNHLLQLIVLRYANEELQLGFDDFLNCLVQLENASRVFQALSTKNKLFIHLNINEFIILTMNI
ncbi:calpain-9 [Saccopteryx leptura]|uniref:calpain-9 n=1 Tax=Saccopteryx leptura TaxID=249018 RepID=UPI00339D1EF4